jgi:hypothetical protein
MSMARIEINKTKHMVHTTDNGPGFNGATNPKRFLAEVVLNKPHHEQSATGNTEVAAISNLSIKLGGAVVK